MFKLHTLLRIVHKTIVMIRRLALLILMTLVLFVLLGAAAISQNFLSRVPDPNMKASVATVSSEFFMDMLALEISQLKSEQTTATSSFSFKNATRFLFELITNTNPSDPKSLVAREIPGLENNRTILLYGSKTFSNDYPLDIPPIAGMKDAAHEDTSPPIVQNQSAKSKDTVFIYHSHNRESWLPELEKITDPDLAYDPKKNITLLGERMKQRLEKHGISTIHSTIDYPSIIQNFKYSKSYVYSKKTVETALSNNKDVNFWFDIHRDSQRRGKTTITINNKDYAQIYFVVGEKNPDWEKNMEFAKNIHNKLNEKYPGISKGIYNKNSIGSNNEYNQSHSPNSSLIEIGGVDNTLAESLRTAEILADVIADLYWEAQKVDAPVKSKESYISHNSNPLIKK